MEETCTCTLISFHPFICYNEEIVDFDCTGDSYFVIFMGNSSIFKPKADVNIYLNV